MYKYLNHVRQGTVYPAGVPEGMATELGQCPFY